MFSKWKLDARVYPGWMYNYALISSFAHLRGLAGGGYGFADRFMILTYLCPTI